MGNLSCGNLDPPPSSGGQAAAGLPSALHEDSLTKRFRRCRSPFRELPKSDRLPVGIVIGISSESRSPSPRNGDRHRSEYATSEVLPSYSAFKRTTIFQLGVAELHRLTAASAFTVSLWSSRVSRLVSPTGRG